LRGAEKETKKEASKHGNEESEEQTKIGKKKHASK
jgi:hypothetical protein